MTGTYQEYRLIPIAPPPRRLTSSRADRLIAVMTLTMRAVVIYVQGWWADGQMGRWVGEKVWMLIRRELTRVLKGTGSSVAAQRKDDTNANRAAQVQIEPWSTVGSALIRYVAAIPPDLPHRWREKLGVVPMGVENWGRPYLWWSCSCWSWPTGGLQDWRLLEVMDSEIGLRVGVSLLGILCDRFAWQIASGAWGDDE